MIVGSSFEGDDLDKVKWVQHDMYDHSVGLIPAYARWQLVSAEKALGVETVLGKLFPADGRFDHRALQGAHDLIAAQFRWKMKDDLVQVPHLENDRRHDLRVAGMWQVFLQEERAALIKIPEFVQFALEAIAMQDSELGYEAERRLAAVLRSRYSAWSQKP